VNPNGNIETGNIRLLGREVAFTFPKGELLRTLIGRILSGQEYPILTLPEFRPAVIVDIGANVGATALFFHSHYPEAEIHCFEPSSLCHGCLARNTATFPTIHDHHLGLYDRDCETVLYEGHGQPAQNSVVSGPGTEEHGETIRLAAAGPALDALGLDEISILKLDTEGCEVPILESLGPRIDKTDLIYVEYHNEDDRRTIDTMLTDRFVLFAARADRLHVGTMVYLARHWLVRVPALDALRIDRPDL
jgi:FkbM family methyltransferase